MRVDPRLARSALVNGLAGLVLAQVLGLILKSWLGLSDTYLLKVMAATGLVLGLLGHFLPWHGPRNRLGPANQVTLARAILTALLVALAGEGTAGVEPALAWTAFSLALVAAALDGLDGELARRLDWASPLGARFDMEVDALLVAGLALVVWSLDRAGVWVLAAGAMRYLFVAAGAFLPWLRRPLPPSRRRQTICVVQVLSLTLALAPPLPTSWAPWVAALGLASLTWSFGVDLRFLARSQGEKPGRTEAR